MTLRDEVLAGEREISPWCADQVTRLPAELWAPAPADADLLPPAARAGLT